MIILSGPVSINEITGVAYAVASVTVCPKASSNEGTIMASAAEYANCNIYWSRIYPKKFQTEHGESIIDIPRDRETTLITESQEYPEYPSLLSISNIFKQYRIVNSSLKTGLENLSKIPKPLVAQIAKGGSSLFSVIYQIDDKSVKWFRLRFERSKS